MSLHGKNVIITGGALGAATAHYLAEEGASIAYVYHEDTREAKEVLTGLPTSQGQRHAMYQADLRTEAGVRTVFEQAKRGFPNRQVHIAINNVGKVLKKPMSQISEDELNEMYAVNTKCAFFFIKWAGIVLEDGGKIVSIVTSLLTAFTGMYSAFAGTKAPVEHFTRAAAKELMHRRISVNALGPGPMDTPLFYTVEAPMAVAFHKAQALDSRLTRPYQDISPIIKSLVTDGQWINGQTIFANA